jgi:hypothetical protein
MMFMCTTRFEIEEEQLAFIKDLATQQELEAAAEEKAAQAPQDTLDPISDNEEDESLATSVGPSIQIISERSLGKRRRSIISNASDPKDDQIDADADTDGDEDDAILLPPLLGGESSTQQRVSGRVRKRSRLLDGYEVS